MFRYKVTFLGGSTVTVFAESPRQAMVKAAAAYKIEAIRVNYIRREVKEVVKPVKTA